MSHQNTERCFAKVIRDGPQKTEKCFVKISKRTLKPLRGIISKSGKFFEKCSAKILRGVLKKY